MPFALKLQPFLGHQGRCLRHFRVLGKKCWKVPGGVVLKAGLMETKIDRVLNKVARSSSTMVYRKQPSLWSHMGLGGVEDLN